MKNKGSGKGLSKGAQDWLALNASLNAYQKKSAIETMQGLTPSEKVEIFSILLKDRQWTVRLASAKKLTWIDSEDALALLSNALRDKAQHVRYVAFKHLYEKQFVPLMDNALPGGKENPFVRKNRKDWIQILLSLFTAHRNKYREEAWTVLEWLCETDDFPVIQPFLEDEKTHIRRAALLLLEYLDVPEVEDLLAQQLQDHRSEVRAAALDIIGKKGIFCLEEAVEKALYDDIEIAYTAAIKAHIKLYGVDSVPSLRKALEQQPEQATPLLENIAQCKEAVFADLALQIAEHGSFSEKALATKVLANWDTPAVRKKLQELLASSDLETSRDALQSLYQLHASALPSWVRQVKETEHIQNAKVIPNDQEAIPYLQPLAILHPTQIIERLRTSPHPSATLVLMNLARGSQHFHRLMDLARGSLYFYRKRLLSALVDRNDANAIPTFIHFMNSNEKAWEDLSLQGLLLFKEEPSVLKALFQHHKHFNRGCIRVHLERLLSVPPVQLERVQWTEDEVYSKGLFNAFMDVHRKHPAQPKDLLTLYSECDKNVEEVFFENIALQLNKMLSYCREELQRQDGRERIQAILRVIEHFRDLDAIPHICKQLNTWEDQKTIGKAIEVLGALGQPSALPSLFQHFDFGLTNHQKYLTAIQHLGIICKNQEDDKNQDEPELLMPPQPLRTYLDAWLKREQDARRLEAHKISGILLDMGFEDGFDNLQEQLESKKPIERKQAARYLGEHGDASSCLAILPLLRDKKSMVRKAAVKALHQMGLRMEDSFEQLAFLRNLLTQEPHVTTWELLCKLLQEWGEEGDVTHILDYLQVHIEPWNPLLRAGVGPWWKVLANDITPKYWPLVRCLHMPENMQRDTYANLIQSEKVKEITHITFGFSLRDSEHIKLMVTSEHLQRLTHVSFRGSYCSEQGLITLLNRGRLSNLQHIEFRPSYYSTTFREFLQSVDAGPDVTLTF